MKATCPVMLKAVLLRLLLFLLSLAPFCGPAAADADRRNVTLTWDPNPEPDLADYVLYYGTTSGNYPNKLYVGNTTRATVFFLREDTTYFFILRARNIYALESDASNEVAYTVPGAAGGPVARDDRVVTTPQTPVSISVLANDYYLVRTNAGYATNQAAVLTIASVTQGAHGAVATAVGGLSLTYTSQAGFLGPDSFTYTVQDSKGALATAMATVDVLNTLAKPLARDDALTVPINSASVPVDVLANDVALPDPSASLTVTQVASPANGNAVITGGGSGLSYQPNPSFSGTNRFTYVVTDPSALTATGTVTMNVTVLSSVNPLPPVSTSPTFLVSWQGSAKVGWFDIYWQEPGVRWQKWVRTNSTAAWFTGQAGHQYLFYSVATDLDGNTEQVQKAAEAATLVTGLDPYLAATAPQRVNERETLAVSVAGTNPDLPSLNLTYGLVAGPAGAMIDPATGVVTWTPSGPASAGTYEFKVSVSDSSSPPVTAQKSFQVTVLKSLLLPVNGGLLESFSSQYNDSAWAAARLTDGVKQGVGNSWASAAFPAAPQAFVYSFANGQAARLDSVVIYNYGESGGASASQGVEIALSWDKVTWNVITNAILSSTPGPQRFALGNAGARFLRVSVTSGYSLAYWELGEIEAYGRLGADVNLLLPANGGTLEAFGSQFNNSAWAAANLSDGTKQGAGNSWASVPFPASPQFFTYSFTNHQGAQLDYAVLYNFSEEGGNYNSKGIQFYSSWDNANWTLVSTGELASAQGPQSFDLRGVTGSFVKVAVVSGYSAAYWELGEIEVYGRVVTTANLLLPVAGTRLESFASQFNGSTWAAARLTDGVRQGVGGSWASAAFPAGPQTFVYSFTNRQVAQMEYLVVNNFSEAGGTYYGKDFEFYTSWDGVSWTLGLSGTLASSVSPQAFPLGGLGGRYAKLALTSGYAATYWELGELELYGTLRPDYAQITGQPQDLTSDVGGAASFAAVTASSSPVTYQWKLNGTNLVNGGNVSGANSGVLRIAGVQAADAGSYEVVVSNATAVTASHVADLTLRRNLVAPANGGLLESFSSQFNDSAWAAAHLTDGVPQGVGGSWASVALPASPQAFVYSFANHGIAHLDYALLYNYGEAGGDYSSKGVEFYSSWDSASWTLVRTGELARAEGPQRFDLGGVTGRYVKVAVTSGYSPFYRELGELEVYGTLLPDTNLVLPAAGGLLESFTSQYNDSAWAAARLTDGVKQGIGNSWASTPFPAAPQSFAYSFANHRVAQLDYAVLYNFGEGGGVSSSRGVEVYVSWDAVAWSLVRTGELAQVEGPQPFALGGVTGRYVKVAVTSGYSAPYWELGEIEVYGSLAPDLNLVSAANGGLLEFFTSQYNDSVWAAARLTDGVPQGIGNSWASAAFPAMPQSFVYSFTNHWLAQLDSAVIYNFGEGGGASSSRGVEIYLSWDGVNWSLAQSGELSAAPGAQAFDLGGAEGRYLKVVVTSGYSTAYWELGEIEVYGMTIPDYLRIVNQPQNTTNAVGTTASFLVAATSSTPLTYQWKFNGTSLVDGGGISGSASPTLTIAGVQFANAGNYSVVVSNVAGVVASAIATLAVDQNLVLPANGGVLESFTSQYNGSTWSAAQLTDGVQQGVGDSWASVVHPAAPQAFVYSFTNHQPAQLDYALLYNFTEPGGQYHSRGVQLYVSWDSFAWTLVRTGELARVAFPQRFDLGGAAGRYVKLAITSGYDVNYWELGEVEVYGRLLPDANLLLPANGGVLASFTSQFNDTAWAATRLTDGVAQGSGASWASSAFPAPPQSFVYSFTNQQAAQLDYAVLYNFGEAGDVYASRGVEIYVSWDAVNWSLARAVELAQGQGPQPFALGGLPGRYVRVSVTSGYSAPYWELGEIQVYGRLLPDSNLLPPAVGGLLESFSSQYNSTSWAAANLTDGVKQGVGNSWASAAFPAAPQTFVYSFTNHQGAQLDYAVLYNFGESGGASSSRNVAIYTSVDALNWQLVRTSELLPTQGGQTLGLGGGIGRYVKVAVTSGYDPAYWELGEVEVYGVLIPNSAPGAGQLSLAEANRGSVNARQRAAALSARNSSAAAAFSSPLMVGPRLTLNRIDQTPAARWQLSLTGQANGHYRIEASTDLVHWTELATVQTSNGVVVLTDPHAESATTKFYRAVRLEPLEGPTLNAIHSELPR